jgi:DNA polymerase elongation subunit (family B)
MSKEIKLTDIKKNASYLKVMGAFVQDPNPGVYGLENNVIIMSNDASALYPTIEVLLNIGYETLYGRIYDVGIIDNLIKLLKAVEQNKSRGEAVKMQAKNAFVNALQLLIKNYTSRKSVANKKEFTEVNLQLSINFFEKIVNYLLEGNSLENIFSPKTDREYFLLKSNLYPLFETINWLSEKNKGYSQLLVDYIYHPKIFYKKYAGKEIYLFTDINSTKTKLITLTIENIDDYLLNHVLSPYGVLFYKHNDKLAFTVQENIKGLRRRRVVKNAMLCIEGIIDNFGTLTDKELNIFLNKKEDKFLLTEEELNTIFSKVDEKNPSIIPWRIKSLKNFEFEKNYTDKQSLFAYLKLRAQQMNNVQKGIKTSLNSGYGITGLITYQWSNPLLGNSITNGGKIFGIKTFQQVAVQTIHKEFNIA